MGNLIINRESDITDNNKSAEDVLHMIKSKECTVISTLNQYYKDQPGGVTEEEFNSILNFLEDEIFKRKLAKARKENIENNIIITNDNITEQVD